MIVTDNIQQTQSSTPAMKISWRFGDLPASELLPVLQQHLTAQDTDAQWQLVWLNNDGRPVIGLLPKVAWCVYFNNTDTNRNRNRNRNSSDPTSTDTQSFTYKVIKNCRDNNSVTTTYMSYADWQDELITYSKAFEAGNSSAPTSIHEEGEKPSYYHGLIGFIGYDIAAHELSPAADIPQTSQPCAVIGHYDIYLTPTDATNSSGTGWDLNVRTSNTDPDNEAENPLVTALISYLNTLDKTLSNSNRSNKQMPETESKLAPLILTAQWSKLDYRQAFEQTQNYLKLGDCYQINLTQAWRGQFDNSRGDVETTTILLDYLPALHRNTQAPFAGYLGIDRSDQPTLSFELLSCSPELFFTFIKDAKTGKHHIRTKPIKGTIPRGINTEQDLALKQQLTDSNKDRAENVMIVDLLRNDLGKYAKIGSVKVPQLFTIESFSNVHHMVSTITAELKEDSHPLAVLFGSLPAGSITGTPKRRAVEIISELEAAPRGGYCGTLGYMNFDGSGQWNVLIRTLQADTSASNTGQVSLWAGGGITIASDCDAEYQECLDKVGNLLNVLKQEAVAK
ncbi:anthranilate synthase component I family protein [Psychrobacter sp. 72-O-c]|uniref:anthranilate synthase component I family protein n=1 Tax=Psychrobacter sp. 72-O-c TaxID=2774125 RepID=UPI00191B658F|nr:anthranilate synthase component I family protein [Psychrobacter sp. 72-O-c]